MYKLNTLQNSLVKDAIKTSWRSISKHTIFQAYSYTNTSGHYWKYLKYSKICVGSDFTAVLMTLGMVNFL